MQWFRVVHIDNAFDVRAICVAEVKATSFAPENAEFLEGFVLLRLTSFCPFPVHGVRGLILFLPLLRRTLGSSLALKSIGVVDVVPTFALIAATTSVRCSGRFRLVPVQRSSIAHELGVGSAT